MRLLPIHGCRPGMRLAKKIYSEEGVVLLSEHVELTESMLRRLSQHGIDYLYIEDKRTEDLVIPELVSEEVRLATTKIVRKQFRQLMEASNRKKTVHSYDLSRDFNWIVSMLIDDLSRHEDAMHMLTTMQITDHYLFQHSINVCIYTSLLGLASGYSREQLMVLGLGALLHDIGKTQIKQQVLMKPGRLNDEEFEEIKKHPVLGYQMLKDEPNIPLITAHCAFQHHERLDGSGYPRGITGTDIHEYARLIGLVDAYDAMTTHRVYRNAMMPHQVMEILYSEAGTKFEQSHIELFRDKIAIYPIGVEVKLNTGESGVVVDLNSAYPHRPIIRILQNEVGEELAEPYEVDLSKRHTILIEQVHEITELEPA